MTNANVEQIIAGVDGQTLTVKYKGGEKKIIVPPDIPIVTYVPSDKSELNPGVKIFIFAGEKPDGTLQAPRVETSQSWAITVACRRAPSSPGSWPNERVVLITAAIGPIGDSAQEKTGP